jgi:hypothetical protein
LERRHLEDVRLTREKLVTDYAATEELFNKRLELMTTALEGFPIPPIASFAVLHFLKSLLDRDSGRMANLQVKLIKWFESADERARMSYDLKNAPKLIILNHRLIDGFNQAQQIFGAGVLPFVFDCFLIHELLHHSQGMGDGRYSGLSSQSPNTLLMLDYQADAMAVVAMSQLAFWEPSNYDAEVTADKNALWATYANSIRYALGQMEVFTHLIRKDLDRQKISRTAFSLDKFQRTAIWQYQYHRIRNFNKQRLLADFQIMSQPNLYFRNLEAAWAHDRKCITRHWPASGEKTFLQKPADKQSGYESRPETDPFCILAAASQFGTTRFVRCPTVNPTNADVFGALFDGNLEGSRPFFEDLFKKNPWLVGKADGSDPDRPGDDGGDPPSPHPIPQDSGRRVRDLDLSEKSEFLSYACQSTMFPLTTMEKPVEFA